MTLKTLPADARPREKLLARGAAALSDAELLAILLRTGTAGRSVLQMADELLQTFGGLAGLLQADAAQLAAFKGLGGSAKRAELLAVMELARRALSAQLEAGDALSQPETVRSLLQARLAALPYEMFAVLFLDAKNRLLAFEELFRGSVTGANVCPREVARRALALGAAAVVLAHNHPSGDVQPSAADVQLTRQLKDALALLDVQVHDHFIVAPGQALSMLEAGLMP